MTNITKVVDDTLIYDVDLHRHFQRVESFLQSCRENKITLNKDKFKFTQQEVDFVGYRISSSGIQADPKKVQAIRKFLEPKNITDLSSFMGLANQLGEYSSNISKEMEPLRALLSKKNIFKWTEAHTKSS